MKRSGIKGWKSVATDLLARWRYRRVWRRRLKELDERGLLQSGRVVTSASTTSVDLNVANKMAHFVDERGVVATERVRQAVRRTEVRTHDSRSWSK